MILVKRVARNDFGRKVLINNNGITNRMICIRINHCQNMFKIHNINYNTVTHSHKFVVYLILDKNTVISCLLEI
jgi:hypothetical protein